MLTLLNSFPDFLVMTISTLLIIPASAAEDTDTNAERYTENENHQPFLEIADDTAVVATYNGGIITQAEVDAFLSTANSRQRAAYDTPEGRKDIIERLALNEAMAALAYEAGFGASLVDKISLRQAIEKWLVNKMEQDTRNTIRHQENPREYYDANIDEFSIEQIRVRHILVSDKEQANLIRQRIDTGEDFAVLASEFSEDRSSSQNGGDVGWFGRGRMAQEFEDAAFVLNEGEITGPIKTRFGYHIIKCEGKRSNIPFDEAKERILRKLERETIVNDIKEVKSSLNLIIYERD